MNKKALIFSSIVAGLALVSIVLLFIPLVDGTGIATLAEMFGVEIDASGKFSLFSFGNTISDAMSTMFEGLEEGMEEGMEGMEMIGMIGMIFTLPNTLVLAINCGILAFAILSILAACNVIKSTKAAKAFSIVAVIFASFAILFTIILAGIDIAIPLLLGSMSQGDGPTIELNMNFAALFPIMAIAMVVFAAIALRAVKKAAKQAAAQQQPAL